MASTAGQATDEGGEAVHRRTGYVPSRVFDVHRWTDYPALENCIAELCCEIEATEERQRARNAKVAKSFRAAVRCLVLDLYVAWVSDPNLQIGVPRSANDFTAHTRYDAFFLSYRTFKPAFDGLTKLGYLQIDKLGNHDPKTGKGWVTRIRATKKLIARMTESHASVAAVTRDKCAETIILKGPKDKDGRKPRIDYEDTPFTESARANLAVINAALARHWYDLDLTPELRSELDRRLAARLRNDPDEPSYLDLTARHLHRVFNNGRWDEGGRFYGGWWQHIPKEFRRYITIDLKPTVEVDYSGMHAVMLYAAVGAELPSDPYEIGVLHASRDLIKVTFNKLINAESKQLMKPPEYDAEEIGLDWNAFKQRIVDSHTPIQKFFYSGEGVRLQARDAEIAEAVMFEFASKTYPCLPVHDSFIVHHALADDLKDVMLAQFRKYTGVTIDSKVKRSLIEVSQSLGGQQHTGVNILEDMNLGDPQFRRWYEWLEVQSSISY